MTARTRSLEGRGAAGPMQSSSLRTELLPRLGASLLGASLGALLCAFLDANAARAGSDQVRLGALLGADLGLIVPLALVLGSASALGALLLLPADFPRNRSFAGAAQTTSDEVKYRWLLLPSALVFGTWIAGRLALRILASSAPPPAAGAALALVALSTTVVVGVSILALARLLGDRRPAPLGPRASPLAGVLASVLAFALLVALGTTSGSGGALALFGVFKRPELDLRAPAFLLVVIVAALLVPPLRRPRAQLVAVAIALAPLALTRRAALVAFEERPVAVSVERAAPVGKLLLGAARKLSDRDHDRFAERFGGGDCDGRDPAVNPGADDVPGNGRDEDCSGADAAKIELSARAPEPKAQQESLKAKLPEKPNVLLVTVDTLRYDLGYMGNARKNTPNIDRLAAKSAIFERAYSLASYTAKSLAPMLIGKYGSETHRGWSHFNRFDKSDHFLAERLQGRGIHTISVQGHWYFTKGYGFERGFDVLDDSAAPKAPQAEGDRTSTSDKLSDAAIAELAKPELEQRQFFMWMHYTDPHAEYVAHEGFDFGNKSRDLYDSEVAFVDRELGRVLDALAARPFAARTLIMLSSDHGEAFGEHGMIRHGFELWEELVRVPLLIYVPGVKPTRVTRRRSAIDNVPTVLDVFGFEPAELASEGLSGSSLLPDVFGQPGEQRPIFVDMPAGPYNAERQALIEGDLKLIFSGGRPLGLYDLGPDPDEKLDLADQQPEKLKQTLERAKAFKRSLKEVRVTPEK